MLSAPGGGGGGGGGVGWKGRRLLTLDMIQRAPGFFMTLPIYICYKYQNIYIFVCKKDTLFIYCYEEFMTFHISCSFT